MGLGGIIWGIIFIGVLGSATGGEDILHRPGALFVRRGTVSLIGSQYRVLLHLHPYMGDKELVVLNFYIQNLSTLLSEVKTAIAADPEPFSVLQNTVDAFESQINRATETHASLRSKNALLKELFPPPKSATQAAPNHNRPFRQSSVLNFFGLASYGQVQELQKWAESTSEMNENVVHAVDQQFTFINKTADRVNDQEIRLNQLTALTAEYSSRIKGLTQSTSQLRVLQNLQDATLTMLKGSVSILEYSTELRLLLDEELARAQEFIKGKVPLSLLSPSEFHRIMEDASRILPQSYSFSASPADMALFLSSATLSIVTKGDVDPYYGVLEFPIHRKQFQLFQIQAVKVKGKQETKISGLYELDFPFLAVKGNEYFALELNQLLECLTGRHPIMANSVTHLCTSVTSVSVYQADQPPSSCAAAVYFDSKFIPELCPQSATIDSRTTFSFVQENQWLYSSPSSAHLMRVFCPPEGEETHSSLTLDPSGGLLQLPEGCSGTYGDIVLPATYSVQTKFRVPVPVHRPLPQMESAHWRPISTNVAESSEVLDKLTKAVQKSSSLKMPLKQFESTLKQIKSDAARSRFHAVFHAPSFAPTLSVITAVLVVIMILVAGAMCWCIKGRKVKGVRSHASSSLSIAPQEIIPLHTVTGPAGSTPFPIPPARRPLPAPPISIQEIDDDAPVESRSRHARRSRRRRQRSN